MQGDSGTGSVSEEDKYFVLSSSEDSSTPDECGLGLGLSLGGFCGNDGSLNPKLKASRIGPKILTAEDFDSVISASSSSPLSCSSSSSTSGRANGGCGTKRDSDSIDASQVVGWPPIRAYRMNNFATNNGKSKEFDSETEKRNCSGKIDHQDGSNLCLKPSLIKVNVDGVPIGRKVDLNVHNCYETLSQTLQNMFFSTTTTTWNVNADRALNMLDGSSGFALTYEDKEGDMMLVGDVPWRMFVNSVKRLRIMRSTKANGIICM